MGMIMTPNKVAINLPRYLHGGNTLCGGTDPCGRTADTNCGALCYPRQRQNEMTEPTLQAQAAALRTKAFARQGVCWQQPLN